MRTMQGTVGNLELSMSSHTCKPFPCYGPPSMECVYYIYVAVTTTGWYIVTRASSAGERSTSSHLSKHMYPLDRWYQCTWPWPTVKPLIYLTRQRSKPGFTECNVGITSDRGGGSDLGPSPFSRNAGTWKRVLWGRS